MEWLRDATNALGEEDSLLNKGLNNSFLNITDVGFFCMCFAETSNVGRSTVSQVDK